MFSTISLTKTTLVRTLLGAQTMAILILGQSTCGICSKVISKQEESCSFPSFISTTKSEFRKFSGNNFHIDCFRRDPLANETALLANSFRAGISPATRVCGIDGQLISAEEEFVFVEYVADDENSFLRRNVYKNYRLSNLDGWLELPLLVAAFDDLKRGQKHLIPYADKTLKVINTALENSRAAKRELLSRTINYEFTFPGLHGAAALKYFSDASTKEEWFRERAKSAMEVLAVAIYIDAIVVNTCEGEEIVLQNKNSETNNWLKDSFEKCVGKLKEIREVRFNTASDSLSENHAVLILDSGSEKVLPSLTWKLYSEAGEMSEVRDLIVKRLNIRLR